MDKMSDRINGDVDNEDCVAFFTGTLGQKRRKDKLVAACSRAAITEYWLIQVDNVVKQSKEA